MEIEYRRSSFSTSGQFSSGFSRTGLNKRKSKTKISNFKRGSADSSSLSPQNKNCLTNIEKSMMLLKILKKFEEKILVDRQNEQKQKYRLMQDQNALMQKIKAERISKNLSHPVLGNVVEQKKIANPTKASSLSSQVVLDKLDINNQVLENHLRQENLTLKSKIQRGEAYLSNQNKKKSNLEWNQYLKSLDQRINKKRIFLKSLLTKKTSIMKVSDLNSSINKSYQSRDDEIIEQGDDIFMN